MPPCGGDGGKEQKWLEKDQKKVRKGPKIIRNFTYIKRKKRLWKVIAVECLNG